MHCHNQTPPHPVVMVLLPKAFSVCSAHMWTEDAGVIYPNKTRSTRVDTFLSPFHYLRCLYIVLPQ